MDGILQVVALLIIALGLLPGVKPIIGLATMVVGLVILFITFYYSDDDDDYI